MRLEDWLPDLEQAATWNDWTEDRQLQLAGWPTEGLGIA